MKPVPTNNSDLDVKVKAQSQKLERIFSPTISFQVPLFQRPYVWTEERNWQPLWDDILPMMEKSLRGAEVYPHFLGAVVLEQLEKQTGSIETREVIDGQQRFTTLQLFLIAARDLATKLASKRYISCYSSMVTNNSDIVESEHEVFKLWPTNSDRLAFKVVHAAGSPDAIEEMLLVRGLVAGHASNIIDGYKFFYGRLKNWFEGNDQQVTDDLDSKLVEDRLAATWLVVKNCLQLVVIDLESDDETQVIFETLNARGEDLLPADLIKNFLFRRAVNSSEDVSTLYDTYWSRFETQWWRTEVKQGRLSRPIVDIFINYYLAMMTRDDVRSSHLFNAFKTFVASEPANENSLLNMPTTAAQHIIQLARYAEVFKVFYAPAKESRLNIFLRRLDAVDTTTVYPFLLYAYGELSTKSLIEFEKILALLESYLMRRMICGLTAKNYNRFFVDMIKAIDKKGELTAAAVAEYLLKSKSDSAEFPDDTMLRNAVVGLPLYGRLAQKKVRSVLEALDMFAASKKSEYQPLQDNLTIEHVMPQSWKENWPLPAADLTDESGKMDPMREVDAHARRGRVINSIGNLTLITESLNPALSNSAWLVKRPELLKFSRLNLTRYFHDSHAAVWDESSIAKRSGYFCDQLVQIWPFAAETQR